MEKYIEIDPSMVGNPFIKAFGRTWIVADFMGRILASDVGKRIYYQHGAEPGDGLLQVENDEQRDRRREVESAKDRALAPLKDPHAIPNYVLDALRVWHSSAVLCDPQAGSSSREALARAHAREAWLSFEDACLQWERAGRASLPIAGPTGRGPH